MGISTLQSYKGAQIFEALGLDDSVVQRCFKGTATRIKGSTFYTLARDALAFHELGYPSQVACENPETHEASSYALREAGEYHYRIGEDFWRVVVGHFDICHNYLKYYSEIPSCKYTQKNNDLFFDLFLRNFLCISFIIC